MSTPMIHNGGATLAARIKVGRRRKLHVLQPGDNPVTPAVAKGWIEHKGCAAFFAGDEPQLIAVGVEVAVEEPAPANTVEVDATPE